MRFQLLVAGMSLLAHCSGQVNPPSQASLDTPSPRSSPVAQPENGNCNFSDVKTVWISHFTRSTIATIKRPEYPPEAVERGIEGLVNVIFLVDADGKVIRACAVDGNRLLGKAAEEAVLQWKFNPPKLGSSTISPDVYVRDSYPFRFVLDKTYKPSPPDIAMIITPQ